MQVGDLIKLTKEYEWLQVGALDNRSGIILSIDSDNGFAASHYRIMWTDGEITWEYGDELEVVCK